tara:strand:+ start:5383 stop:5757 length:375 start_codon:yes stop_codon:yes gene_type:complete
MKEASHGVELWVQKRISNDSLSGLLEFPGGKIEGTETPEEAALRETNEEVGVEVSLQKIIRFAQYQFTPLILFVHIYWDDTGLFATEGYHSLNHLIEMRGKIPPNNIQILADISKRFQAVVPLK